MNTTERIPDDSSSESQTRSILAEGLAQADLSGKRVLILVPDGTRSGPMPLFFRLFHEILGGEVAALDYLIALGTHQPMSHEAICRHFGVTPAEMAGKYAAIRVFNHHWERPETFVRLGVIPTAEVEALSDGFFRQDVPVTVNRLILDYDHLIVCGPVFPHEVAGFSGGNKYFFPGISGPEVIDFSHWLGALITNYEIIGKKDTPVRRLIDRAAGMIDLPKLFCCFVVKPALRGDEYIAAEGGQDLHGLFVGPHETAWPAAVELSEQVNILWTCRTYNRVLSVMPRLYDDIWTAAKGMYKLEPVIADGGEVTILAPHIEEISYTHGRILDEVGYHVRDYFVKQWDRFKHYPWGVLAHSTHLRGLGSYEGGVERARIDVHLATRIPAERCRRVNLGYRDPDSIRLEEWAGLQDEGVLLVPHAGEMLYRARDASR